MSKRRCERLLGECCLGKTGWWIGELMGENQAYPLWLYPRIHVQPRDPTGSRRTSSDWTISKPHGHLSAISQFREYRIIKPLSVSAHLHSAKDNLRSYLNWVVGLFLDISHVLCHPLCFIPSRIAPLPLFHIFIMAVCPTRSFINWLILWRQLIHFSHGPTCLCSSLIHSFTRPTLIPICSQIVLTFLILFVFLSFPFRADVPQ